MQLTVLLGFKLLWISFCLLFASLLLFTSLRLAKTLGFYGKLLVWLLGLFFTLWPSLYYLVFAAHWL